jgi:hypothetical protein
MKAPKVYRDAVKCPKGHHVEIVRRVSTAGKMAQTVCPVCRHPFRIKAGPVPVASARPPLTQEQLKKSLRYEPETGLFYSRITNKSDPFTAKNNWGYILIKTHGRTYRAHRLAWLYVYGEFPELQIDHINGVPDDNRIENLRIATLAENMRNLRKKRTGATSQFKGVSRRKGSEKWQAAIRVPGRKHQKHLGNFDCEHEAAHAYNKAAIEHFGEFAVLNPVGYDYEPA